MANDEVGKLSIKMGIESAQFDKSLASIERNLKGLGGELATLRNKGKEWGDSLEGLKKRNEVLTTTLTTQEAKVKKLREAYDKSALEKGKDAKATEDLAIKLNKAVSEYQRTETEIKSVNKALQKQQTDAQQTEKTWKDLGKEAAKAGEKMQDVGEKMKDTGEALSVGLTAPVVAFGGIAGKVANDFDVSQGKMQAAMGLTEEEADKLHDSAVDLWKNGFGESLGEASAAIVTVSNNMRDIPTDQLGKVAEQAMTIADVFDKDVNEVTRSANQLMKDFGITSDESFDLITTGFQNGLDFSGEFLDTINEYAPQFKAVGFTADEFFDKLLVGAEAGAFNLDKVGDAVKEFNIRAKDGSEATSEAFESLNLDAKEMSTTFAEGGEKGAEAFNTVLQKLMEIEDPIERNEVAVKLFGTQFEDLEESVIAALGTTTDEFENVEGATKKAGDAVYDNFSTRATMAFRDFTEQLQPTGEILLDVAEEWLPKVADALEDITQGFADMSPKAQENAIQIAAIAAATGPAIVGLGFLTTGIGGIVKVGGGLAGMLGAAGGKGLLGRIGLMGVGGGPVGLAIAGTAALGLGIYALTEASRLNVEESLNSLNARGAEIEATDLLIGRFETLREKNSLSTDEILRYMDIMTLLKDAKSEEVIKALSDEQAVLLEKSGLTNEQMGEFLKLNGQLVETSPSTVQAISEQGNAYVEVLDKVKELNAAELERLTQDTYTLLQESMDAQKENLAEQKVLQDEIAVKEAERSELLTTTLGIGDLIKEQDLIIAGIKDEMVGKTHEERTILAEKLLKEQEIKENLDLQLQGHDFQIEKLGTQIGKKQESLGKTEKELALFNDLAGEYEALILSQVGITSEKGKGIDATQTQIGKLQAEKGELDRIFNAGQMTTGAYQTQIGLIDTQIGKLQGAQGELETINRLAGTTVYKEVKIKENPSFFWDTLDQNLGRSVSKQVTINTLANGYTNILNGYADGTDHHPGGPFIAGEEGFELGRMGDKWEMLNFGRYDRPSGYEVFTHDESRNILGALNNIPGYATGVSSSGEADRVTNALSGQSQGNVLRSDNRPIIVQSVLNGRIIAEETLDINQQLFGSASSSSNFLNGMR